MRNASPASRRCLLLFIALALTACSGTEPISDVRLADEAAEPGKPRGKLPVSTHKHPVPVALMTKLYEETAAASGVEEADIELVQAERRRYSDASLDCPQPNVSYAQVIVDGYWVILRAGGEEFDYRADSNGHHRRCTGATKRAPIRYPPED